MARIESGQTDIKKTSFDILVMMREIVDYIAKPFLAEECLARIKTHLEKSAFQAQFHRKEV
jgi:DNA-binding response OmpR family regulator